MITAGVDVGSLSSDAVILNDGKMAGYAVITTGADMRRAAEKSYNQALEQSGLRQSDVEMIVSTGYGRATASFAPKAVTEITCHGKGARFLFPEASTVIDIGGQDSKVIELGGAGKVVDFVMNDRCAAGTGRFLEVMAQALEVGLEEMGEVSLKHKHNVVISSTCTVFAESEVISLLASGYSREDILNGIHQAIASRVYALGMKLRIRDEVVLTGGVVKNIAVAKALEKRLGIKLKTPPEPQIVGALGAAIYARSLL
ncbi:MAG: acyl-CoA dehydratase activase [Dehalococcoidia bacterium]